MTADDEANDRAQRRRHAQRGGAGQRARGRHPAPRLLGRRRRPATRACSARTCSTRARSCPRPTTGRSSSPRRSPARSRASRGASTAPPSSSATRRPARWTRSTGPTTSSRRSRRRATRCREWFPLVGLELGYTNIVPVDYVAAAMDHIAHEHGLDGQAFHLCAPKSQRSGEVLNTFARAAHAPQMAIRIDKRLTDALPKGVGSLLLQLPGAQGRAPHDPGRPRDPRGGHRPRRASPPSSTRATPSARWPASGIEVPPLEDYAERIWDYWERKLDPDLYKDRSFEAAVNGRTVVITGASSGIGRAAAMKIAGRRRHPAAGRALDGQARGGQGRDRGGRAAPRTSTRPTSPTSTRSTPSSSRSSTTTCPSTCWSTTPGARSGARSRSARTASTTSSARCSSTTSARSA